MVVLFGSNCGLQTPIIPLFDVVGSVNSVPSHISSIWVKFEGSLSVIVAFTGTLKPLLQLFSEAKTQKVVSALNSTVYELPIFNWIPPN